MFLPWMVIPLNCSHLKSHKTRLCNESTEYSTATDQRYFKTSKAQYSRMNYCRAYELFSYENPIFCHASALAAASAKIPSGVGRGCVHAGAAVLRQAGKGRLRLLPHSVRSEPLERNHLLPLITVCVFAVAAAAVFISVCCAPRTSIGVAASDPIVFVLISVHFSDAAAHGHDLGGRSRRSLKVRGKSSSCAAEN